MAKRRIAGARDEGGRRAVAAGRPCTAPQPPSTTRPPDPCDRPFLCTTLNSLNPHLSDIVGRIASPEQLRAAEPWDVRATPIAPPIEGESFRDTAGQPGHYILDTNVGKSGGPRFHTVIFALAGFIVDIHVGAHREQNRARCFLPKMSGPPEPPGTQNVECSVCARAIKVGDNGARKWTGAWAMICEDWNDLLPDTAAGRCPILSVKKLFNGDAFVDDARYEARFGPVCYIVHQENQPSIIGGGKCKKCRRSLG